MQPNPLRNAARDLPLSKSFRSFELYPVSAAIIRALRSFDLSSHAEREGAQVEVSWTQREVGS